MPTRFGLALLCLSTPLIAQEDEQVEVNGVKVDKEFAAEAEQGIYYVGGERLSRREALALQDGKVRHPVTGQFISAEDAEKAKTQFPTHDGRWLSRQAADEYHTRSGRPWVFRTRHGTVLAPLPLEVIETKIAPAFDQAVEKIMPLTGAIPPHPDFRPAVLIAPGTDAYVQFGDTVGGAESAYGCFLPEATVRVSGADHFIRPVIANWIPDWGEYYVRHAAAMAWCQAYTAARGKDLPNWFLRGVGGLASLAQSDYYAAYFGGLALGRGGVPDLAATLPSLQLSGDMGPSQMNDAVFMAGMALDYGMRGKDPEVTAALQAVTEAFKTPEAGLADPLKAYVKALEGKSDAVSEHLQGIRKSQETR